MAEVKETWHSCRRSRHAESRLFTVTTTWQISRSGPFQKVRGKEECKKEEEEVEVSDYHHHHHHHHHHHQLINLYKITCPVILFGKEICRRVGALVGCLEG